MNYKNSFHIILAIFSLAIFYGNHDGYTWAGKRTVVHPEYDE